MPACLPRLQGVSFGVFGLGNRQYEHFCAMGKKVSKAMQALGAAEVVPRGEGDDDKDIDDDFDAWSARLFAALDASPLVAKNKVGGRVAGCCCLTCRILDLVIAALMLFSLCLSTWWDRACLACRL